MITDLSVGHYMLRRLAVRNFSNASETPLTTPGSIEQLERAFAAAYGVPGAVATGFGRGAIYLALEAIGVRGGEVLLPDFLCAQVLQAVRLAGATPAFYPVALDLLVRPEAFRREITPETRAAVLVHYFGIPQPALQELAAICAQSGVALVEDCALALLTDTAAGRCGTFGDYSTFSFTKNNWCYGGGMALALDSAAIGAMRDVRAKQFRDDSDFCLAYGRLSRLDFEANMPLRAAAAEEQGSALQDELGKTDARFHNGNFFDAAPCTLRMSEPTAMRALDILAEEPALAGQRRRIWWELVTRAAAKCERRGHGVLQRENGIFLAPDYANGSFLTVIFPPETSGAQIQRAAREQITLRPAWNDFQSDVPTTPHAGRLATLEIHPELSSEETERIGAFLEQSA